MSRLAARALAVWCVASVLLLAGFVAVLARQGGVGFHAFQVAGHGSSLETNFLVACLSWALLGLALVAAWRPALLRGHGLFALVLLLLAFLWLDRVREPHVVKGGDFDAYFEAAKALRAGQPIAQLPDRLYLYPPLLATLLSPLVPLGLERAILLFALASWAALLASIALVHALLRRVHGASSELAALLCLALFAANVPISRSFIYHQANLFVLVPMLACLWALPRWRAASAACLAVAVQLKVYPALLVLAFLRPLDLRWLVAFALASLAIVAGTSAVNGFGPYLDFLQQATALQETAIRNASIDAVITSTRRVLGATEPAGPALRALGLVLRLAFAGAFVWSAARLASGRVLAEGDASQRARAAAFCVLPIAMLVVSPSIWEHHPVLLLLSFPALALALRTPGQALALGLAWLFLLWMPTFDVWPLSLLRLFAFALLLAVVVSLARSADAGAPAWRTRVERGLAELGGALRG